MSTRLVLCLFAALIVSPFPVLADAPATTQPAAGPTTQPAARWHFWPAGNAPRRVAANASALWFTQGDGLIRYDVTTRKVQVFGHLEGLPFGPPRDLWLADDGRTVFMDHFLGGCLWDPKQGWSHVPDPSGPIQSEPGYSTDKQIVFDTDGTMIGSFGRSLFRWADGAWQKVGELPRHSTLAPSAKGYYLRDAYSERGGLAPHVFVDKDLANPTPLKLDRDWSYDHRFYTVKGELFGVFSQRGEGKPGPDGRSLMTVERGLFRIGPKGFEQIGIGDRFGIDFKGGGPLELRPIEQGPDAARYGVAAADGPAGEVTVPDALRTHHSTLPMPLRDASGRLWLNGQWWDGRAWTTLTVPGCPTGLRYGWDVMDPQRFRLEADPGGSLGWRNLFPDVPPETTGFDPKNRTGWLCVAEGEKKELRLIRFAPDGRREVLRTLPAGKFLKTPTHRTADGDWWWLDFREPAAESLQVWRLTKDGKLTVYPSGHSLPLAARGRPTKTVPELFLSPQGHLWLWHADNYFARYDPGTDGFVRAQPWDEFAFQFAGRTLSMVPSSDQSVRPHKLVGVVYTRQDGVWQPLGSPDNDRVLYARAGFTHGDRMLVYSSGSGLFEYDARAERWILLYRRYAFIAASFDPAGRRLLAASNFVLALDGDPFEVDVNSVIAARKAVPPLDDLLRRLDDPQFAVREKASAELKRIAPKVVDWLRLIEADRDQPPEVRARVREALAGLPPQDPSPPPKPEPSLYDKMHPVLGTDAAGRR